MGGEQRGLARGGSGLRCEDTHAQGQGAMSQARLREALNAGGPGTKDKTPPVADGILSVTPDTPEAEEWRNRRSAIDSAAACSSYLDEDDEGE